MKKLFALLTGICLLQACNNSGRDANYNPQADTPVMRQDTTEVQPQPGIDTTKGEDRVDLQQRSDSAGSKK